MTSSPIIVSPLLLARLHRQGIVYPYWTVRQARIVRLGLPVACAMLVMESGGGHMEFGHDRDSHGPCPGYGWGAVTKAKYLAFRAARDASGRTNGVGACQLTSIGLQNQADSLGGCWLPRANLAVGFHYLAERIRQLGLHAGIASYNGSGSAAEHYATELLAIAARFRAAGCGSVIGTY